MRLGEQLVAEGLVAREEVEEALGNQVLQGGRLGTSLVELNYIGLEDLALALGRQHQTHAALEKHFDALDRELAGRLSPELAAHWHLVPLGHLGEQQQIAVASTDPLPEEALFELESIFDSAILGAIAPELRIAYWLERIYGIERLNRFKRVSRPRRDSTDHERRGYVQTLSDAEEPAVPSQLARISVRRLAIPLSGEIPLPVAEGNLEDSVRAIRQATSRRRVGDLVTNTVRMGFAGTFTTGMLLTIRNGVALGWKGFCLARGEDVVDAVAVPLEEPSLLRGPFFERVSSFGPCENPSELDLRLWRLLGQSPAEVAVVPIEVLGEVVALLYAHSADPISAYAAGGLAELARAVGAAFDRLIRAAQR